MSPYFRRVACRAVRSSQRHVMLWHFIEHFTYAGLSLALFGGALGLPIPETVALVAGGMLAQQEVIRWSIALPLCIVATASGDAALYWAGRRWGKSFLQWRLVRRVLSADREATLLAAYRRNAAKFVFVSRHVMGVRTAACLTAGMARMPFWKFLTVDLAAVAVSLPVVFGIAFLSTDRVGRLMAKVHHVEHSLAVAALAVVLTALAVWAVARSCASDGAASRSHRRVRGGAEGAEAAHGEGQDESMA